MNDSQPRTNTRGGHARLVFVLVVLASLAAVLFTWQHTPAIEVQSDSSESGYVTERCLDYRVSPGQELESADTMITFNQKVLKNDIESLRRNTACSQALTRHTNTLIVVSFAAATAVSISFVALRTRRSATARGAEESR